ncbi:hypothetical protein [Kribbella shirazensis]|uniref:Uncharacterized protein n=1 Tax=Kribbella shirazensis TaxID=1105143 RepID=A0A7X6A1Q1_9ACTN|nr:hypothetical protein [Kribbella shirazensis]NIK58203.1 hypothetical protein [Kribbella shirazensis]
MSSLDRGIHRSAEEHTPGEYTPKAGNAPLALPYSDDFEYAGYPTENVNGVDMTYLERRGGTPRYTADQNGAFEVVGSGDGKHGNVLQQRIHADNRGYTWNVWGDGSQNRLSTATPATILGDHTWADYRASIDVRFDPDVRNPALPNFAGLGVRQVVTQGSDLAAYALRLSPTGAWQLRKLDTVVASGIITDFDPATWHRISLEAKENQLTAAVDGSELTTWTDSAPNTVMAGRIALTSGYYQNTWDNLSVVPVEGHAWRSDKLDDTARDIAYTGAAQFQQSGFANYNRTLHVLSQGATLTAPFQGTGLNIFGATARATLDVAVDGAPAQRITVGATGTRQTSYWLRGLTPGPHTLTVTVVSGTFTIDGIDVLTGPEWGLVGCQRSARPEMWRRYSPGDMPVWRLKTTPCTPRPRTTYGGWSRTPASWHPRTRSTGDDEEQQPDAENGAGAAVPRTQDRARRARGPTAGARNPPAEEQVLDRRPDRVAAAADLDSAAAHASVLHPADVLPHASA